MSMSLAGSIIRREKTKGVSAMNHAEFEKSTSTQAARATTRPRSGARLTAATAIAALLSIPPASGTELSAQATPAPGQRVALVTGATSGLGRELAMRLGARGDHVIVHGRNEERGAEVVDASSRKRQKGLARRICSGVRQSGVRSAGLATMAATQRAREVATFSRCRL